MRIFKSLYERIIHWSAHRHAPYYLGAVSFAESSFFPVPPDIMLITMSMATPKKVWRYATITSICSILGGIFGYLIGYFFIHIISPYITYFGYQNAFLQVQHWFVLYGFWIVFIAGFTPIPYKLFTIGAGAMSMPFLPFILASIVGRSMRFFLVSTAMFWGGQRLHQLLNRYVEYLGWIAVLAALIALSVWVLG